MREYDDYTLDSTGGSLRVGYPIFEQWRLYGTYRYTDNQLSDIVEPASYVIEHSKDLPVTSSVKAALVRDTRNRYFGATAGSRHSVSVEYAGGPFGGDSQFTKLEGSTSWFFPVIWGTVFHFQLTAAQAFENETGKLPVYERYYLGGISTIRGFKYAKVSPKDPVTGDLIGGDKMWYSNFEYIFPILPSQGLDALVFYDIGQVYNDNESWGDSNPVSAVGVGFRWLSPLGPLNVVWGVNLNPRSDEDNSVWDFSVGGTF
jgi:outer membrane protein insertion porin family